jgi:hypothetical protein
MARLDEIYGMDELYGIEGHWTKNKLTIAEYLSIPHLDAGCFSNDFYLEKYEKSNDDFIPVIETIYSLTDNESIITFDEGKTLILPNSTMLIQFS